MTSRCQMILAKLSAGPTFHLTNEKALPIPRKPGMCLTGVPSHIVQRGNDRHACFFKDENYLFYLHCLEESCKRYGVAEHVYVLRYL